MPRFLHLSICEWAFSPFAQLAGVNGAPADIAVLISLGSPIFPRVGLPGHAVVVSYFLEAPWTLSTSGCPCLFHGGKHLPVFHTVPALGVFVLQEQPRAQCVVPSWHGFAAIAFSR